MMVITGLMRQRLEASAYADPVDPLNGTDANASPRQLVADDAVRDLGPIRSFASRRPLLVVMVPLLALCVFSLFLDIGWPNSMTGEAFIGHADQASVAEAARSIAEGKGPVVSNYWIHTGGQGIGTTKFPHLEPYWSIYGAYSIAPFFKVFGANRTSLLAAASAAKALAAIAVAFTVFMLTNRRLPTFMAGYVVLFEPSMLLTISGLTDIYMVAAAASFAACFVALRRRSLLWAVPLGFTAGYAMGQRPPLGYVFLAPLLGLIVLGFTRRVGRDVKAGLIAISAAVVAFLPYLKIQYDAWGTLISPGSRLVSDALRLAYVSGDHNDAFYNPTAVFPPDAPNRFEGSLEYLKAFGQNLADGRVVPFWLMIFGLAGVVACIPLIAVPLWRRLRGNPSERVQFDERVASLMMGGFMMVVAVVQASLIHFEARYWAYLIPLTAIAGFGMGFAWNKPMAMAVLVLVGGSAYRYHSTNSPVTELPPAVAVYTSFLPDDAVVLTGNPWQFAFHTRRGAIAMPYTGDLNALLDVAGLYGATYIVADESFSPFRHWTQKKWFSGEREIPASFVVEYAQDGIIILRILSYDEMR
ncbi:MAG: hypothetical protein JJE47_14205 [Acidimicrobiia bacterium]|nr:hypothetical protein [Acidimicrobiia bacterium]